MAQDCTEDDRQMTTDPIGFFRRKSIENLPFLMNKLLGFNYVRVEYPYVRRVSDFLCQDKPRMMLVVPRFHLKTSFAEGYVTRDLLRNPEHSWLIESESSDLSEMIFDHIKRGFTTDEMMMIWGDLRGDMWSAKKGIKLNTRPANCRNREPNIYFSSVSSATTGHHPTHLLLDDIMGEGNSQTPEQREKTIEHYKRMMLVVQHQVLFNATRWHFDDVVNEILEQNKKISFDNPNRYFYLYEPVLDQYNNPLFPEVYDIDWIEQKRTELGAYLFAAQMMNQPIDPTNLIFPYQEVIHPYMYESLEELLGHDPEKPKIKLNIVITDDPSAPSTSSRSDPTAIMVAGVDVHNHVYILEYCNKRFRTVAQHVNKLIQLYQKWTPWSDSPIKVGMEKGCYEKMMKEPIALQKKIMNVSFRIQEIHYTGHQTVLGRSKHSHYISIQPYFENGMVHIRKGMEELVDQLISITYRSLPTHDDLADTLVFVFHLIRPPKEDVPVEELDYKQRYMKRIASKFFKRNGNFSYINYINEGVK